MRKHMVKARQSKGFTLIELLVVVVIIGVLAAIAIPTFFSQQAGAQDAVAESDVRNMATAQKVYKATDDNGEYADDVEDLEDAGFVRSLPESSYDVSATDGDTFQVCVKSESDTVFALDQDGGDNTEGCNFAE